MKFSQPLAEGSRFVSREFVAGKDAVTLARDIVALDQQAFSATFQEVTDEAGKAARTAAKRSGGARQSRHGG